MEKLKQGAKWGKSIEKKTNKYIERKEKKEGNSRFAKINRGRWRIFIYIKDKLQGEKNSRKGKERNKCRKIIIDLEKLKL